jgi:hypothetical protein
MKADIRQACGMLKIIKQGEERTYMDESIKNISIRTNDGEDFYLLVGEFLDVFYIARTDVRKLMIEEPPEDMGRKEYVPFLAAVAHKIANDYNIEPPQWVFESRCYLPGKSPYFACNAKGNLRLLFMYKSPSEFKHRNLFVDENVLSRV